MAIDKNSNFARTKLLSVAMASKRFLLDSLYLFGWQKRLYSNSGNYSSKDGVVAGNSMLPYGRKHFNFSTSGEHTLKSQLEQSSYDDGGNTPVRSPVELFRFLNEYVVEQYDAKRILSVAVYNHYCRFKHNRYAFASKDRIILDKSNILLVGPSGSGTQNTLGSFMDRKNFTGQDNHSVFECSICHL